MSNYPVGFPGNPPFQMMPFSEEWPSPQNHAEVPVYPDHAAIPLQVYFAAPAFPHQFQPANGYMHAAGYMVVPAFQSSDAMPPQIYVDPSSSQVYLGIQTVPGYLVMPAPQVHIWAAQPQPGNWHAGVPRATPIPQPQGQVASEVFAHTFPPQKNIERIPAPVANVIQSIDNQNLREFTRNYQPMQINELEREIQRLRAEKADCEKELAKLRQEGGEESQVLSRPYAGEQLQHILYSQYKKRNQKHKLLKRLEKLEKWLAVHERKLKQLGVVA